MKKQVYFDTLKDMQKYIIHLNTDDYEVTTGDTDPSVISYVRNYYNKHLPVDITAWMRVNGPHKKHIYKNDFYEQIRFVHYTLCGLLFSTYDELEKKPPMVISTHVSKSLCLPVYLINLEKYGIELVLKSDFYDWKVSVKSNTPLDFDFMGLFNTTKVIPSNSCNGFPKNKVYGSYSENHSEFTIEFISEYDLYTFIFLLRNYLGIQKEK